MTTVPDRRPPGLPLILSGIFFLLALIQISRHIMWRDELRPWQIIQQTSNPIAAQHEMRFDAVPMLWNEIIFVLTRFTQNPFLMQFVHVLFATAVVFVFTQCSPFPKLAKVLFPFGYFTFYEYAVISRNYVLVFLLMMIACALITQPRVKMLWLTLVLGLLTQASIWGAGIAGLLMLVALVKCYFTEPALQPRPWQVSLLSTVVLFGVALAYFESLPGPGPTFTATWLNAGSIQKFMGTFCAIYRAWFPVPAFSGHFWNSNLLDQVPTLQFLVGLILFAAAIVALINRPIALGFFVLGYIALMAFEFHFRGSARHHGHLFMILIAACWIATSTVKYEILKIPALEQIREQGLTVLFGVHAVIGVFVALAGLVIPFSASWATARYIKANISENTILVAVDDYCASPIATWLSKPIYFPQMQALAIVNTQNPEARIDLTMQTLLTKVFELSAANQTQVLLLLSSGRPPIAEHDVLITLPPIANIPNPALQMQVLPRFEEGVVADESESLYLLRAVTYEK
ncbi:MAG TPA: hypothetical protein VHD56_10645 [Tepidisphaeraceae bacterium]|nr:hypothetical protein [Tepidisphaeraceae bacterium]